MRLAPGLVFFVLLAACGPSVMSNDDTSGDDASCEMNTGTCEGQTAHWCPDGTGYVDTFCDPALGLSCNAETGLCEGDCAPQYLGRSYIGCEYYPTVTGNAVGNNFPFAVAISNTSVSPATVTIDGGALTTPVSLTVAPGSVATQNLPWVPALKLCTGPTSNDCLTLQTYGALAINGGYHLRSTAPVTVYQFNPLPYMQGIDYSFSNDASLLLPTNAWTGSYLVATWQKFDANEPDTWPGLVAVTASQDATTVSITTTANTPASGGAPAFTAGVPQSVTLQAGDVIELASMGTYADGLPNNLTGTVVAADKPVQVVAAHYCTYVPDLDTGACDHLEESMFPVEALSTRYVVSPAAVSALPNGRPQVVRIVATQANTNLTYDPPQSGAPTSIAFAGGYAEIPLAAADYLLTADHKVLVMAYMEGQDLVSNTGDPAMALAVPVDQYRSEYLFHAPTNYEENWVNVTAPTGAVVTLDGTAISTFTAIGASGYSIAKVTLGAGTNGNHSISGNMPFGISVYGYGQFTSYWYPGGLDLSAIPVE